MSDSTTFHWVEQVALFISLAIAIAALCYAWVLGKRVFAAEQGTKRMQEIAQAVRDGSNAYLRRQFTTVGIMLLVLTVFIVLSKWPWDGSSGDIAEMKALAISRGIAFCTGAIFSGMVGFFGKVGSKLRSSSCRLCGMD